MGMRLTLSGNETNTGLGMRLTLNGNGNTTGLGMRLTLSGNETNTEWETECLYPVWIPAE